LSRLFFVHGKTPAGSCHNCSDFKPITQQNYQPRSAPTAPLVFPTKQAPKHQKSADRRRQSPNAKTTIFSPGKTPSERIVMPSKPGNVGRKSTQSHDKKGYLRKANLGGHPKKYLPLMPLDFSTK